MKFPYGISHFASIRIEGYYYCDRTDRIPKMEEAGKYLLFIRPRRFGKSLWLSTLRHYYDIAMKERFQTLFGELAIGKNPTLLHNKYLVLQWDFSCVDPTGSVDAMRQALHDHINMRIRGFARYYKEIIGKDISINPQNALDSFGELLSIAQQLALPFYLFIDEYDNFANELMSGIRNSDENYKLMVHEKGPLKTLFKSLKSSAGEGAIERMFITGVSPVVLSDITSGFNIAENIYLKPMFNDLCGFTEAEVEKIFEEVAFKCSLENPESKKDDALSLMRTYYNGYSFAPADICKIYNPTLALYFIKAFQEDALYPREMLDANLASDEAKLEFIAALPGGRQLLLEIVRESEPVVVTGISSRFGISAMIDDVEKNKDFLISFLYYFGVLSISKLTESGQIEMRVPNLVTRGLYVNQTAKFLLPNPLDRDAGKAAAEPVFTKGDIAPLCNFVEQRYFKVFRNADYKWANELTVKTAFLTLLYDDIRYIMDSEHEVGRGYADLTMIIRPDMRKYALLDVLIEFKYVKLSEAGITGNDARDLSHDEIKGLPIMQSRMVEAKEQARRYSAELEKKYKSLRLRTFAVVSLGFERIWGEIA
ncbi:MAG: AAA family ATPase [Desulfamplus sp.]|nr:AAA family ATPase [Desulfamplus sp.]